MSHKRHGRRRPPVTSPPAPVKRLKTWATRYSGLPEDQHTILNFDEESSRRSKFAPYDGPHSPGSVPPAQPSFWLTPRMKKSFALSFILMAVWFGGRWAYRAADRALTIDLNPKLGRAVTERFGESLRRSGVRSIDPNGKWVEDCTWVNDRKGRCYFMATMRVEPPAPLAGGPYGVAFRRELDDYNMPLSISVGPDGAASVYYEPKPTSNFDEVNAHVERLINTAIAVADHENLQRDGAARREADNKRSWRE